MWIYEKKLQYPVNICTPDVRMAKFLMAQYGGPDSDEYGHKPHRIQSKKTETHACTVLAARSFAPKRLSAYVSHMLCASWTGKDNINGTKESRIWLSFVSTANRI